MIQGFSNFLVVSGDYGKPWRFPFWLIFLSKGLKPPFFRSWKESMAIPLPLVLSYHSPLGNRHRLPGGGCGNIYFSDGIIPICLEDWCKNWDKSTWCPETLKTQTFWRDKQANHPHDLKFRSGHEEIYQRFEWPASSKSLFERVEGPSLGGGKEGRWLRGGSKLHTLIFQYIIQGNIVPLLTDVAICFFAVVFF